MVEFKEDERYGVGWTLYYLEDRGRGVDARFLPGHLDDLERVVAEAQSWLLRHYVVEMADALEEMLDGEGRPRDGTCPHQVLTAPNELAAVELLMSLVRDVCVPEPAADEVLGELVKAFDFAAGVITDVDGL